MYISTIYGQFSSYPWKYSLYVVILEDEGHIVIDKSNLVINLMIYSEIELIVIVQVI